MKNIEKVNQAQIKTVKKAKSNQYYSKIKVQSLIDNKTSPKFYNYIKESMISR